jgi:hypothetical protein
MEKTLSRDIHKTIKVIQSCITYEQLVVAYNFYFLFKKRWSGHKFFTYHNHIENIFRYQKSQILNEE